MLSSVKLYGKRGKPPRTVPLQAGAMKMIYEEGSLRYITFSGIEIIRMIYASVRDKSWITVNPEISGFRVLKRKTGFRLSFEGRYRKDDIDFAASFKVEASSEGHLMFGMKGKALSAFSKNRIGFCILHPVDNCTGKQCRIVHPDRTESSQNFPDKVSPDQPFTNIAGMRWMPQEDLSVELDFQGDIFETEDQRNWTDASYKTYCTPLELPFPVLISEGQEIVQQVEMRVRGKISKPGSDSEVGNTFCITDQETSTLPEIGIGISSLPQPPLTHECNIIKNIGFSHLQATLFLDKTPLDIQYSRITGEAEKTSLPVELFLFFGTDPEKELRMFLNIYRKAPLKIKSILILSKTEKTTPDRLISSVVHFLRQEISHAQIGVGTNCNFAQLNRSLPDTSGIDFINFAIHPQEHASDNRSLTENMAGQQYTVRTALQFKGCKPVHVSPVTLQRRFNANTENFENPRPQEGMPSQIDPRQMSLFGAAWTVGSLKYLLEAGASSITYFETVGERGIMMGDDGSRWPVLFPAGKGMLFPVFHVFRILLKYKGSKIIRCISNRPLITDGFAIGSGKNGLVFLANMSEKQQTVRLTGINKVRTIFIMCEGNYIACAKGHSVDRIDSRQKYFTSPFEILVLPYETRILEFTLQM
jgi:D-apionolactonase